MEKLVFSIKYYVLWVFIIIAIPLIFATYPISHAYAQCPANQVDTDLGCIPQDPALFASKLYGIGLGFIGGVALLFIIYGGYLILSSQGDPIKLEKGKSYIVSSIVGLVLALSGFTLYRIIALDIINIPGFK